MFRCRNCDCEFEEAVEIRTTYENYCGVGGLFPNHNYMTYLACPNCHSEEYDEVSEDYEEEGD